MRGRQYELVVEDGYLSQGVVGFGDQDQLDVGGVVVGQCDGVLFHEGVATSAEVHFLCHHDHLVAHLGYAGCTFIITFMLPWWASFSACIFTMSRAIFIRLCFCLIELYLCHLA